MYVGTGTFTGTDAVPVTVPVISPGATKTLPKMVIFWCTRVKPVGPFQRKRGGKRKRRGEEKEEGI